MRKPMRFIMFGPPGVGKGTQAKILSAQFRISHISTGDLLRAAVADGTELGRRAKAIMDAGQLVPDDVMIGIVREVLASPRVHNGFIIDGFPRTLEQARALSKIFDELHIDGFMVLNFAVDDDEVIHRLNTRLLCEKRGHIYNMATDNVRENDACPQCGGRLIQRVDDGEETVRKRLQVYHTSTEPVLDFYRKLGVVTNIDGSGSIDLVSRQIRLLVES